jgi:hypothetical protein
MVVKSLVLLVCMFDLVCGQGGPGGGAQQGGRGRPPPPSERRPQLPGKGGAQADRYSFLNDDAMYVES